MNGIGLKFRRGDRIKSQHPYVREPLLADGTIVMVEVDDWYQVMFDDIPIQHGFYRRRSNQMDRERPVFEMNEPSLGEIDELWRLASLRNKADAVVRAFARELMDRVRKS